MSSIIRKAGNALTALLLASALPGSAVAHWQYTRWGMTVDQVIAAAKGQVRPETGHSFKGTDLGASGTFSSGSRQFTVRHYFGTSGLGRVHLSLMGDEACRSLKDDLQGIYGTPIEERGGSMPAFTWLDVAKGNRIFLSLPGGICMVQYSPILSGDASGL